MELETKRNGKFEDKILRIFWFYIHKMLVPGGPGAKYTTFTAYYWHAYQLTRVLDCRPGYNGDIKTNLVYCMECMRACKVSA